MAEKNNSLPKWVVQILAWLTGVAGMVADYGFNLLGKDHIAFVYYALCIGIGFGINPGFVVRLLLDGYTSSRHSEKGKEKKEESDDA